MHGYLILGLVGLVRSLRFLTLNHVYEKGKMSFIQNNHSLLKFGKPNNQNYGLFTTVVSKKKLFFYTDGIYYKFTIDSSGISLRLASTVASKIDFYTQEVAEESNVKVIKWDNLVKKRREEMEKAHEEKEDVDKNAFSDKREKGTVIDKDLSTKKRRKDEDEDVFKSPSYRIRSSSRADPFSNLLKSTTSASFKGKKGFTSRNLRNHMNDAFSENYRNRDIDQGSVLEEKSIKIQTSNISTSKTSNKDEIESDSDLDESKSLNILIEVVDKDKKTFMLKNEANLCVTYFQKLFILAPCSANDRQLFKLVKIESVLKNDEEKNVNNEDKNEILDEIASSSSSVEKQSFSQSKRYGYKSGKTKDVKEKAASKKDINKRKKIKSFRKKPESSDVSEKPEILAVDDTEEGVSVNGISRKDNHKKSKRKKKTFLKEESDDGLKLHDLKHEEESKEAFKWNTKQSNYDEAAKDNKSDDIKIDEEGEGNKSRSLNGLLKRIEKYDIKVPKIENEKQEIPSTYLKAESSPKIEVPNNQNTSPVSFRGNQVYGPDVNKQYSFNNPYEQPQNKLDNGLEFYCKSILDTNQGRMDMLPSNCLKFANFFSQKAPSFIPSNSPQQSFRSNQPINVTPIRQPVKTSPPQPVAPPVKPKEEKKPKGNSSLLDRLENNLFGGGDF